MRRAASITVTSVKRMNSVRRTVALGGKGQGQLVVGFHQARLFGIEVLDHCLQLRPFSARVEVGIDLVGENDQAEAVSLTQGCAGHEDRGFQHGIELGPHGRKTS